MSLIHFVKDDESTLCGVSRKDHVTSVYSIAITCTRCRTVVAQQVEQVAVVVRALADHTMIMDALQHRPDPKSPWPQATSLGRWFHDVADQADIHRIAPRQPRVKRADR